MIDFAGVSRNGATDGVTAEYLAALERHGHSKLSGTPYGHGVLARDDRLGQRLRRAVIEAERDRAISEPLLSERGTEQFVDWLRGPAPEGGDAGVNRFAYGLYRDHSWMRRSFPHLDGGDAPGLLRYLQEKGHADIPIPEDLLPASVPESPPVRLVTAPRASAERERLRGVNVVGFLNAEFGLGEAARLLVRGLDARVGAGAPDRRPARPPDPAGGRVRLASGVERGLPGQPVVRQRQPDSRPRRRRRAGDAPRPPHDRDVVLGNEPPAR